MVWVLLAFKRLSLLIESIREAYIPAPLAVALPYAAPRLDIPLAPAALVPESALVGVFIEVDERFVSLMP
ncbi:MAG: hypothetical protein NVSMB6_19420 [Burkholderiaceae bacterium]